MNPIKEEVEVGDAAAAAAAEEEEEEGEEVVAINVLLVVSQNVCMYVCRVGGGGRG